MKYTLCLFSQPNVPEYILLLKPVLIHLEFIFDIFELNLVHYKCLVITILLESPQPFIFICLQTLDYALIKLSVFLDPIQL